jgi:hypothetical protein
MMCCFVRLMTLHYTILLTVVYCCVIANNGCLFNSCWKQSRDAVCYIGCHCLFVELKCVLLLDHQIQLIIGNAVGCCAVWGRAVLDWLLERALGKLLEPDALDESCTRRTTPTPTHKGRILHQFCLHCFKNIL